MNFLGGDLAPLLVDSIDSKHGLYQAIFLSNNDVVALLGTSWANVTAYAQTFNVRVVYMFRYDNEHILSSADNAIAFHMQSLA